MGMMGKMMEMEMSRKVWGFKALVHTGWCKWWLREKVCLCGWLRMFGCFEPRQNRVDCNLWGGGRLTYNLANISAAVWQPTAYTTPNSIQHGGECHLLHNWRFLRYCFYDHSCVTIKEHEQLGGFFSKPYGPLSHWTMCYCKANGCFKIEVGVFIKSLQQVLLHSSVSNC